MGSWENGGTNQCPPIIQVIPPFEYWNPWVWGSPFLGHLGIEYHLINAIQSGQRNAENHIGLHEIQHPSTSTPRIWRHNEIPLTARPWNTTTWPFSAIRVLRSRWTTWVWHTPPLGDWLRWAERWWLALWESGILRGKSDDKSMGLKMLIYWNCLDGEYYWSFILIADSIRFGLFPVKFNANYTILYHQTHPNNVPIVLCSIVFHDHAEIPPIIITSHMGVSENSVPLNPMVLLIIIPMRNGYFIGNIPYFQTNPHIALIFLHGGSSFSSLSGWPGVRIPGPSGLSRAQLCQRLRVPAGGKISNVETRLRRWGRGIQQPGLAFLGSRRFGAGRLFDFRWRIFGDRVRWNMVKPNISQ